MCAIECARTHAAAIRFATCGQSRATRLVGTHCIVTAKGSCGSCRRLRFSRRSAAGKFPAPQAPTNERLDGPERTRTIRQDNIQNRKTLLQSERSEDLSAVKGLRPAPRGRPQFSLSKRKLGCSVIAAETYRSSGDSSQEISTIGAPGCGIVNIESSRTSWAWVAPAGAASSSVRMYSWLMCCPQALSGSCSLSTVARRPAVARLWCCARGSVIGGRRSACGGGRPAHPRRPNRFRSGPVAFSGAAYRRLPGSSRPGRWFPGSPAGPSAPRADNPVCQPEQA
jgi:hypothetical protein